MLKKENEKFSDYRLKYSKLIEKIFNSHSKIPFQLTSDQLIQISSKHHEISIDLFLKTFFKSLDDSQNQKEKSDLIYYVYKILSFLYVKKKFTIKTIESNYVANGINLFVLNFDCIVSNEINEEKMLITFRLTHLFLKIASDHLKIQSLFKISNFLMESTILNSKYEDMKLTEFSHHMMNKILEELNAKFCDIFQLSTSNSINMHNLQDVERESAIRDIKTFMKSFYFGIYNLDFLISKSICGNIVNNLTMKSYSIPERSSSEFFCKKIKLNLKFSLGRFGKCEICKSNANFYCVKYRLPICSSQCKEKLRSKETFYEFVHDVNFQLDKKNYMEISSETSADIGDLKEFSENLLSSLINELSNIENFHHSVNSPQKINKLKNSEILPKCKYLCEMISKILKEMNLIIDVKFFESISLKLFKAIFKCILFCEENLLSVINHLIIDTVKYYGIVIKSQLKILFDEGTKMIDPNSSLSIQEKKVEFFLKLFVSIFLLHGDTFIFILYENFDNEPNEPEIIQNFINILFKILINSYSSLKVKLGSIKILLIISKIINSFTSQISEINTEKYLNSPNSEKGKTVLKEKFLELKRVFDVNPNLLINEDDSLNSESSDINIVAKFFRFFPDLDKEKIGIFLGRKNEKNQKVYDAYLETFNFTNMNLADALRNFLFCFKISGESQIIDRIITKFSLKYFDDNLNTKEGTFFVNSDATYYLSFNIMILHTNMHNPNVSIKDKLSVNSFAKTLDNLNGGKNFDYDFLKLIYENIQKTKFIIYDFIHEIEKDKLKNFMNECFGIKINLSNSGEKNWIYLTNNFQIKMCSHHIIKIIFKNLSLNLQKILDSNVNRDKEFYNKFFDFFVYFLENILNNFNLVSEKVSLINSWISLIDFKNLETVDKKVIRCLKIFIKTCVTKFFLFDGCWPNVFNFIITKHILIERKNSSFCKNEETSHIINKLTKTFATDNIEKIFLTSSFMSQEDFLDFVSIMFNIILSDLENTSFLNLFLLNQIEITFVSYKNKEKLWIKILSKIQVLVGMLSNYDWEENKSSFIEFFVKISETLILREDIKVVEENVNLYLEIFFNILSLKSFDKNLKIKILIYFENFFSNIRILKIIFEKSIFIENLTKSFKTFDLINQNKFLEIIRLSVCKCHENNMFFILDEKLFLLFREFFYHYPKFYMEIIKSLIKSIFSSENRDIFLKFLNHIGYLIEENHYNEFKGESNHSFINEVLKFLLETSLKLEFEEIFFEVNECATSKIIKNILRHESEENKNLELSRTFDDFSCEFIEILDEVIFSQSPAQTNITSVLYGNLVGLLENVFIHVSDQNYPHRNFHEHINNYFCFYEKISNLCIRILLNEKNLIMYLEMLYRLKMIEMKILEKEEIYFRDGDSINYSQENLTFLSPYLRIKGDPSKNLCYSEIFNYFGDKFNETNLKFEEDFHGKFLDLVSKVIKLFDCIYLKKITEIETNLSENLCIVNIQKVLVNFTNMINLMLIIIIIIITKNLEFDLCDYISELIANISKILNYILIYDEKFHLRNFLEISTKMLSLFRNILENEKCYKKFSTKEFKNILIKSSIVDDKSFRKILIEIQLLLN